MADYSNYLYDPFDKDTLKKLEQFPEFKFKIKDKAKVIAYMILTYDPRSDFLKIYNDDLPRRKRESALKAGFELNKEGKFDEWLEDLMVGKNEEFNEALIAFVRMFNIADFPAYCALREIFFKEVGAAMSESDSKKRVNILANMKQAREQLTALERKLFTGEETLDVRNALYRIAERQRLGLRPEEKAREINEKRLDVPDVYEIQ